jgi:hypothetical protein
MFPATFTMTMSGADKGRLNFEPNGSAQAAAGYFGAHTPNCNRRASPDATERVCTRQPDVPHRGTATGSFVLQ